MNLLRTLAYIDGEWVQAQSRAVFPIINPGDDKLVAEVPDMNVDDAKIAIRAATKAFQTWKNKTAKERAYVLRKWYDLCQKHSDDLAQIVSTETGKPLADAKTEVAYGNSFLEWFADSARHINGEIVPSPWKNKQILMTREPMGVVSVITPWNFPLATVTRKVSALMAAGCTCVIKPSEETPLAALAAAELAEQAGVPKGVINVITTSRKNTPSVGKVMCEDINVACISFTGSTVVGKMLYGQAANGVKKVFLELGGNAPFIVFPSADLDHTLEQAMLAKFRNSGQSCICANRFFIHEDVYDEFVTGLKNLVEKRCVLGLGTTKGVTCGPLINVTQAKKVSGLVDAAVADGAQILIGGKFNAKFGNKFYEPTILENVTPNMRVYEEEVFGPVISCLKIKCEEEVLKLANSTRSGLAAYVFTRDLGQAFRMSQKLEFGMVAINDGVISACEPAFGGIKESGIGREGSMHGALDYTELKYTLLSGLDKAHKVHQMSKF